MKHNKSKSAYNHDMKVLRCSTLVCPQKLKRLEIIKDIQNTTTVQHVESRPTTKADKWL